ncbi:extensin-like [Punica granatum]|uniref:Extensin-like n=1 Tax=Punica granatum TaxID=22663 RepID=A0A6P8D716_PUNGR|nr:extensin-like [Punica granatum]
MAEENQIDVPEEVTPPILAHSQPPLTHAPPPLTPIGIPSAYSGAPSVHLPPRASSGTPLVYSGAPLPQVPPPAVQASSTFDDHARIAVLEGTVNQLAANMATNMAELFALFRGPNRASSSSTPPSGQEPMVDPTPWIPPTHAPESVDAPALPTTHASAVYPVTISLPPPPAPTTVPLPLAAFLTSDQTMSAPPPVSMPVPAPIYTAPPPMVFPASTTFAPAHITESFPFPTPQPNISLPYHAPPPLNIPFPESGTPIHAAPVAPLMNFLLQEETEQERRMKKMEETIKALQVKETHPNMGYGDWSLFPGMRLPPKFKILEFTTYEGTKDPRHHLRHYRGKMLQYWDYEEFIIHTF